MIIKVIVDIPAAQVNRLFDYTVPEDLIPFIQVGMRVQVPFGRRQLLAFVIDIHDNTQSTYDGKLKPITAILDYERYLNDELVALSEYLAHYLQVFRISILQTMLPNLLKVKYDTYFSIEDETAFRQLTAQYDLRDVPLYYDTIDKTVLESALPSTAIKKLLDVGILRVHYLVKDKKTIKTLTYLKLNLTPDQVEEIVLTLTKRSAKLKTLLYYLVEMSAFEHPISQAQLLKETGVSTSTIKTALTKNWLERLQVEAYRDPYAHQTFEKTAARELKAAQQAAFDDMSTALKAAQAKTFLLEGVTGSGKTEIYLQLMQQAQQQGQGAILLVPEIALTPQMVNQVKSRFERGVAVLHSGLSNVEKYDEWRRIISGEATIVVGARSSIFAPIQHIGLIIIDEEHETTYKQADMPRYHARDVALWRSDYHQSVVVLGSATPSLESRSRAEVGKYQLIRLQERVNQTPLPEVHIVDMTQVAVQHTTNAFSPYLQEQIQDRLNRHEQIVLMLNRRGYANYLMCRECGYVVQCPHCDISLTYHKHDHKVHCHYCDFQQPMPTTCPQCQSEHLRPYGIGTEKIAETLATLFPTAKVIRMDVDTTRQKGNHEKLLTQFGNHEADILLGTQMIAKGLDFEKVTLVGIINADTALNLPDFRASEKTFQLLTQVAGRTGRGKYKGEVVLQTYNPDHYAIQLAKHHNYEGFFYYEMKRRHIGHYPPYYYTTLVSISSKHQGDAYQTAYELKSIFQSVLTGQDQKVMVLGPTQGAIARLNERYYFQILLKYKRKDDIQRELEEIMMRAQLLSPKGIYISIDHEPLSFM